MSAQMSKISFPTNWKRPRMKTRILTSCSWPLPIRFLTGLAVGRGGHRGTGLQTRDSGRFGQIEDGSGEPSHVRLRILQRN